MYKKHIVFYKKNYVCIGLLWTAPELLSNPQVFLGGTKEGDVYSFGIIMHEIFYRMGTFAGMGHLRSKGNSNWLPCSCFAFYGISY